jgi:hypothetical protein
MTWSAKILSRTVSGAGVVECAVQLSDGTRTFTQCFTTSGTLAELKAKVRAACTQQDAQQVNDEVPVGLVVDLTPDAVIPPAQPTAADLAQAQWLDGYARWQALQRGVNAGWVQANDAAMLNLKSQLDANFKAAYRGLL